MLVGYSRVSTQDQKLELQRDDLKDAKCERVFEDKVSGAPIPPAGHPWTRFAGRHEFSARALRFRSIFRSMMK